MKTVIKSKETGERSQLIPKRNEYLSSNKIRNRKKMVDAAKDIDKLSRKVPNWNSVDEIRKWRGII